MGIDILTKTERKPVLDAARSGDGRRIDTALQGLQAGQLAAIKALASEGWGNELGPKSALLLQRIETREKALAASQVPAEGACGPARGTREPVEAPRSQVAPQQPLPSRPVPPPPPGPSRGSRGQPNMNPITKTPESR